jgi:hypothetical protein
MVGTSLEIYSISNLVNLIAGTVSLLLFGCSLPLNMVVILMAIAPGPANVEAKRNL